MSEGRVQQADGVAAVDRALTILGAIAELTEPGTLAEIARRTGFYKSTILRLLVSLEAAGYVVRLMDGCYALGGSAVRLGLAYERQNPLRQHVLPVLQKLVQSGTESASFHVRHGARERLCLFRVNSHHATLDRVEAGSILPLDKGAAGRVIQLHERGEARALASILSRGERDPSCAGLAVPVFGAGGLLGALSLSGPEERFTAASVASMEALLLAAAEQLSRSLGARIKT